MQKISLDAISAALMGHTHHIIVDTDDLTTTTANTAQTLELISVAAGDIVTRAAVLVETALKNSADGAFNDTAITIGDGNDTDRFLTSMQVNENGTEVLAKTGPGSLVQHTHPLTSLATGLGTSAIDILTNFTPGFAGEIIGFHFVTTVAGTGAGASQVFNLEIGTTNLTGGVLTLTLASQATIGTVTSATAITGANAFGPADTISIEMAASGTVFTAGAGYFVIVMRNTEEAGTFLYTSADTVDLVVNSMSGKSLSDLDTGRLHIFLNVQQLSKVRTEASL